MLRRINAWQQDCTIATSLKMAPTHYGGCVASLMTLSTTSCRAVQNLPKRNIFKGTITQQITSTGRCARAITSRQLKNGTTTNQKLSPRTNKQQFCEICHLIHTDKEIAANKPDIIIRDHTNQKCQIGQKYIYEGSRETL